MLGKMRLLSALCALVAAVIVVWQTNPITPPGAASVDLRSTSLPISGVSSSIKWPVIETTDPRPFDPCEDIPVDVINGLGLGFTPPEHEDGLRCHYDAGNYQMAVEAFVWRTYEQTLPADDRLRHQLRRAAAIAVLRTGLQRRRRRLHADQPSACPAAGAVLQVLSAPRRCVTWLPWLPD
jgi:hypothetical protein